MNIKMMFNIFIFRLSFNIRNLEFNNMYKRYFVFILYILLNSNKLFKNMFLYNFISDKYCEWLDDIFIKMFGYANITELYTIGAIGQYIGKFLLHINSVCIPKEFKFFIIFKSNLKKLLIIGTYLTICFKYKYVYL